MSGKKAVQVALAGLGQYYTYYWSWGFLSR